MSAFDPWMPTPDPLAEARDTVLAAIDQVLERAAQLADLVDDSDRHLARTMADLDSLTDKVRDLRTRLEHT